MVINSFIVCKKFKDLGFSSKYSKFLCKCKETHYVKDSRGKNVGFYVQGDIESYNNNPLDSSKWENYEMPEILEAVEFLTSKGFKFTISKEELKIEDRESYSRIDRKNYSSLENAIANLIISHFEKYFL